MNFSKLWASIFFASLLKTLTAIEFPSTNISFQTKHDGSSDKNVLDYLLSPKIYDKRLLPPMFGPSTVNVSVVLISLSSPDESSSKYDVEFLLEQEWYDSRLKFPDETAYTVLNGIHHQKDIWLPDTNFKMHGDFKPSIRPIQFNLNVYRDGRVEYRTRPHLSLNCEGSMNIFPFDQPLCTFFMESLSYEKSDLEYVWKNSGNILLKSSDLKTFNSYILQNRTFECETTSWRGNYSCLQVEMIFTRDKTFYFATIFIPGLILVTSSFFTFFLEWNAVPARTIIGVTTMLNYFSNANSFRRTLPDVSNLTAMNVWDGVCMSFVFASFVEFIVVNCVGRAKVTSKTPSNSSMSKKTSRDLNCMENNQNACAHSLLINTHPKAADKITKPPDQVHLAMTIDVIARFMFPSSFVMFLLFFFFYYTLNATNQSISIGKN